MSYVLSDQNANDDRVVLGLLNSVEDGATSQRQVAAELGVVFGLVGVYLKQCIKKGLVKVGEELPSRRYACYLTPRGFTEKSQPTGECLSSSLSGENKSGLVKMDRRAVFSLGDKVRVALDAGLVAVA